MPDMGQCGYNSPGRQLFPIHTALINHQIIPPLPSPDVLQIFKTPVPNHCVVRLVSELRQPLLYRNKNKLNGKIASRNAALYLDRGCPYPALKRNFPVFYPFEFLFTKPDEYTPKYINT
jgi:hypothetical protein